MVKVLILVAAAFSFFLACAAYRIGRHRRHVRSFSGEDDGQPEAQDANLARIRRRRQQWAQPGYNYFGDGTSAQGHPGPMMGLPPMYGSGPYGNAPLYGGGGFQNAPLWG